MSKYDNLEGFKFGRWTVLEKEQNHKGHVKYLCRCDCGVEKSVFAFLLNGTGVRKSRSCGCLHKDILKERFTTHGQGGKNRTSTYTTWHKMIQRCNNPNTSEYMDYGGRGITVCDEWLTFEGFFNDMGERPENKTLDRIDVNDNYCKYNCKWSDKYEQAINRNVTSRNSSGVVGVNYNNKRKKWEVRLTYRNTVYRLGFFEKLEDAKQARIDGEIKYFGKIINGGVYHD